MFMHIFVPKLQHHENLEIFVKKNNLCYSFFLLLDDRKQGFKNDILAGWTKCTVLLGLRQFLSQIDLFQIADRFKHAGLTLINPGMAYILILAYSYFRFVVTTIWVNSGALILHALHMPRILRSINFC